MTKIRYILFIFFQAVAFFATAQKQHIKLDHLSTDKGLSQSNGTCILQDSRGFMWFGTQDGLNRYDGYKFTVYKNNPQNPFSISNSSIKDILEDSKGNIWVATAGGGLNKFDRGKNLFVHYRYDKKKAGSLSDDFINCIIEDSGGDLWIGTETGGLNKMDGKTGKFTSYAYDKNNPNSISDNDVTTVFEDSRHRIWVGTFNGGMNLVDKASGQFTRFQHNEKDGSSLAHNTVLRFLEDSRHRLWIGTRGGGLDLLNFPDKHFRHFKNDLHNSNSLPRDVILSLATDDKNNIWIGTENGGLSIFNPETETFMNYLHDDIDNTSLSNNSIYALYKDSHNNMWIGTYSGGIDLYNKDANQFTHYKHTSSFNSPGNNNILDLIEDSRGNIWIGTDGGGVELFDPKTETFTHFLHNPNDPKSICGNYVIIIREDKENNIWMGTCGDGTTVYNPFKKTFRHIKKDRANDASISGNNIGAITLDKDKELWIASWGDGLNLRQSNSENFIHYKHDSLNTNSVSSDRIIQLFTDSKGYVWIGTAEKGLDLFDKKTKTFTHFVHDNSKNSLSDNNILCIYEDRQGNIWIGTKSGLNRLDRRTNQFTNYFMRDGLPGAHIFGILEDDKGNFWISSNNGLSRFNPQTRAFKNFSMADGLQSNEFKPHSTLKSSSGAMYFGGVNGFNKFFPDSIKENSFAPPLVITSFQVFNKEVPVSNDETITPALQKDISETKEITISYKSSVISFEFASLNYTSPEKKQYAYMLEGFDKDWNEVGTKRTATYTNLDAGEYTFKVKGMNNDGSWSSSITSIRLTVTPPFWRTWWFKTIAVVFILGCLFAFYRIRVKTITVQKASLEKQVKERTTEIVLQKEVLSENIQELAVLKDELEQEKYLLDSLMDNMTDSIYFKNKESKFQRVSKFMAAKFGVTVDKLIGKSDSDFQDAIHARKSYDDEQNIQKTRQAKIDYLEKETSKDGSESWVSTTKMPLINAQNEVVGTFGMSRDITKMKLLEKKQHEAALDEAVAQGKFEIASGVMHDIGNAVVGFGSYLTRIKRLQEQEKPENLENLARFFEGRKLALDSLIGEEKSNAVINMLDGISGTQKNNLQEIGKAITEQLHIIANIEDILNIQRQYINGHESKERKPVNISNIINDSLSMLSVSIDKSQVNVSLNIADNLPLIKGDHTKLMQVVLNVLKNSIEAMSTITFEKKISVSVHKQADKLIIEIKDNGIGFDNSISVRLFKKGYTTKESDGGLGLYNSRTIIESHEGSIDISSEGPGKGALTTINFKA